MVTFVESLAKVIGTLGSLGEKFYIVHKGPKGIPHKDHKDLLSQ